MKEVLLDGLVDAEVLLCAGLIDKVTIVGSLSVFCIDLNLCAYEIKYSDKFNVFIIFSGNSLVSKIGVISFLNLEE